MVIEVFISYSHQDQALRNELDKHLSNLKQQQIISSWHHGDIIPGMEWQTQITEHLNTAKIILLLISTDFMASKFCFSIELKRAIERHNVNEARVIPILLRPTEREGAAFSILQMLPTDGRAVTQWPTLDDAFENVVVGIRKAIEDLTRGNVTALVEGRDDILTKPDKLLNNVDWEDAPDVSIFYGRQQELLDLEKCVIHQRCRLIALLGVGGIGKTKLVSKLAHHIADQFEYVIWRSLDNVPPLGTILLDCIKFVSNQQYTNLPETIDEQISMLKTLLRNHRILIILDSVEAILLPSGPDGAGYYKSGYEEYGKFFRSIGATGHQSCVLLTSREKSKEIERDEGGYHRFDHISLKA